MTADNVHRQARAISSDLARVQIEEIEAYHESDKTADEIVAFLLSKSAEEETE